MEEYAVRYKRDGALADGGFFTGNYGMKNARQCARAAIRTGAADAVIIDKKTDTVTARFEMNGDGEIVAAEVADGLTGAAWAEENGGEQTEKAEQTKNDDDDSVIEIDFGTAETSPEHEQTQSESGVENFVPPWHEVEDGENEMPPEQTRSESAVENFSASCTEVDLEANETPSKPVQIQSESGVTNFFPTWEKVKNDEKGGDDSEKGAADNFLPNGQEVAETGILTISVPFTGFDPAKLENLCKMVTAKESLIRAALGLPNDAALPIRISKDNEQLQFPWFPLTDDTTFDAYALFIERLTAAAKAKKRVTAGAKDVDGLESPKFTMRAWLLSLGCIGERFKEMRQVWLQNLPGNASFASNGKYLEMQAKRRKPAAEHIE